MIRQVFNFGLKESRISQEKYDSLSKKENIKSDWKSKSGTDKDKQTKSELKSIIETLIKE